MSIINSDTSIRFYFKDDKKEADKLRKYRLEVNKAKSNYVACIADSVLFEAVYIQYCVLNSLPVLTYLNRQLHDKEINLNAGCPSGTVVSKNKGAGFLKDTEAMD